MFTTINDVFQAYKDSFGSEIAPWDRDTLQTWVKETYPGVRYEDLPDEVISDAFEVSISSAEEDE